MQRSAPGFEASYRRHLAAEQRRAVLEALARSFEPGATVGEIVDAAAALGWTDLGELSLADLADALLTDATVAAATEIARPAEPDTADDDAEQDEADDEDEGEDEDEDEDEGEDEAEDEDEEPVKPAKAAATRGRRVAAAPAKATKATKAAAKPAKAVATKPAAKPAKAGGKPPKVSLDDRMSLDEAAAVLLPLVRTLGEATMQQLEQSTAGAGRRKLRFHIGQLVKNGRLERHGMGRGTFYTLT
ncbi:MAG: hypothetical protein JNK45_14565 [Myxococcales bacterium]|nr:hypothetical protein [Myxococcales bacterium]